VADFCRVTQPAPVCPDNDGLGMLRNRIHKQPGFLDIKCIMANRYGIPALCRDLQKFVQQGAVRRGDQVAVYLAQQRSFAHPLILAGLHLRAYLAQEIELVIATSQRFANRLPERFDWILPMLRQNVFVRDLVLFAHDQDHVGVRSIHFFDNVAQWRILDHMRVGAGQPPYAAWCSDFARPLPPYWHHCPYRPLVRHLELEAILPTYHVATDR
jgi:hypothetical protein